MGDPKGFLKVKRAASPHRDTGVRVRDYQEVDLPRSDSLSEEQASRCMDCGTPFCNWGCPVGNYIPEWNDLMFRGKWARAYELLQATNNFPEFTGRLCPAPCEFACVLGINDDPVTVRENELAIIEHAFHKGYVTPHPPGKRTAHAAAVIGSGPSGLACADELNRMGHKVTVFERDGLPGGILRYGIPDFKLDKKVIDRRLEIMRKEGVEFVNNTTIGPDIPARKLIKDFDAVCLAGGSRVPRDLKIEGRDLKGIHFAMDYLTQMNRRILGQNIGLDDIIDAKDKRVVVIGGGDTGSDCVGTAHRQGAASVTQIELFPRPPECRTDAYPWPKYPMLLKTTSSHEEGGIRQWSILTKKFLGSNGRVEKLSCVQVEFSQKDSRGCPIAKEVPAGDFEIGADMVVLAMGFTGPEPEPLINSFGVKVEGSGVVSTDPKCMTSVKGVFAAGDMRRGQSLIVWSIFEGRRTAYYIDEYLKQF